MTSPPIRHSAILRNSISQLLRRKTEARVHTRNPARGPLLIISGAKDNVAPHAISYAACRRQVHNPGVTEFAELPVRGHSLVIDSRWAEVAEAALDFVKRFT